MILELRDTFLGTGIRRRLQRLRIAHREILIFTVGRFSKNEVALRIFYWSAVFVRGDHFRDGGSVRIERDADRALRMIQAVTDRNDRKHNESSDLNDIDCSI